MSITCDHDLLRIIMKDLEDFCEEGSSPALYQNFYAHQIVNEIHSRDE